MAIEKPTLRPPQQPRSRASLERVLAAGQTLLEEDGYEAFTLAKVSSLANVSIGSIYARVKKKDDLFLVIQDRFMSQSERASGLSALEGRVDLSTRDLVRAAVAEIALAFVANPRLLRVFMHRGIVDDAVAARSSESVSRFADTFERVLLTRRDEISHPDPELAADVAFRMAWGTLARQVMYWPTFESARSVEWDTLVSELGDACAAYLLGGPRTRRRRPA
jgi:AcrR family transcriptional regulator